MPTTIQLRRETLEDLKRLRKTSKTTSYDATIQEIIKKATAPTRSLYGFLGKKTMKQILEGLRDENDRF